MDRNQIIGIVLISVMLMVYMMFNGGEEPKKPIDPQNIEQTSDSTDTNEKIADSSDTLKNDVVTSPLDSNETDSLVNKRLINDYGVEFAPFVKDKGQEIILENDDIKIIFDSKGANPKDVILKNYTFWNGQDSNKVHLIDEASCQFEHILETKNRNITLEDLVFEISGKGGYVKKGSNKSITFKIPIGKGFIEKTYSLSGEGFELGYQIKADKLGKLLKKKNLTLNWEYNMKRTELGNQEAQRSWVNYYTNEGDFDDLLNESLDLNDLKWISHKQRFFNTGLIAENSINCSNFEFKSFKQADSIPYILGVKSTVKFPFADISGDKGKYKFYFGPNDYEICKAVAPKYKENVYLGWKLFGFINESLVRPIFNFFAWLGLSYGMIILMTVLIIKTILFPIAFKSYKSMAKMKVLKPWIEEIKEKNKGNSQAIQMEQMKLYKQVGANPISGCIPQLLQIPIFLSLFNFFPNWIQMRHEGFLWAHDLSTFDAPLAWDTPLPIIGMDHISIFTLLMTLSTLAYTYYNNQINSTSGPMKNIGYIMPIMFFFILNNMAAALTYYYFLNTMITIIQQNLAMRFIDKDKIKAVMEENRRTNKAAGTEGGGKKSKFMQRLEEAQRVAEEKRKAKKNK